jgi:hypothetical protein
VTPSSADWHLHRRELLSILAGAAVAPAAAPAVLRGRYRLLAQSPDEYSARTIRLMQESPVVDMLCQFAFPDNREEGTPRAEQWLHNPNTFTAEDFAVFRSSGVKTLALGTGVDNYEGMLRFMAAWNGFVASRWPHDLRPRDRRGDAEGRDDRGPLGLR